MMCEILTNMVEQTAGLHSLFSDGSDFFSLSHCFVQSDSSVFTLRMKHPFCFSFFFFYWKVSHIYFELFKSEVQLGFPGLLAFLVSFFK